MYKKEKTEKLKRNIKYLIKSRGETRLSLCNSSGLTRTTIYNILEGKVVNVQQSTIRKISDFFGVSYKEIETVDFEEKETIESSISLQGNMNPAAVPIIKGMPGHRPGRHVRRLRHGRGHRPPAR
jgi:transcriptional regulator with XRE-family HTH domain